MADNGAAGALPPPPRREEAAETTRLWRSRGLRVVFTNGCFDLLHPGHVIYLEQARSLGDRLVVGINSDDSVRRLKGPGRPVLGVRQRVRVLQALRAVDLVVPFGEDTPLELIRALAPQVLVKGGDWPLEQIVGRELVEAAGGTVHSLGFLPGSSTSELIRRIREER